MLEKFGPDLFGPDLVVPDLFGAELFGLDLRMPLRSKPEMLGREMLG